MRTYCWDNQQEKKRKKTNNQWSWNISHGCSRILLDALLFEQRFPKIKQQIKNTKNMLVRLLAIVVIIVCCAWRHCCNKKYHNSAGLTTKVSWSYFSSSLSLNLMPRLKPVNRIPGQQVGIDDTRGWSGRETSRPSTNVQNRSASRVVIMLVWEAPDARLWWDSVCSPQHVCTYARKYCTHTNNFPDFGIWNFCRARTFFLHTHFLDFSTCVFSFVFVFRIQKSITKLEKIIFIGTRLYAHLLLDIIF